jgi:hypothetical protein
MLFIVFHYDILNSVSNLHLIHLLAGDLAVVLSPSATWSSKVLLLYLSQQITNVIKDRYYYSITLKQLLNFKKNLLDSFFIDRYHQLFLSFTVKIIPSSKFLNLSTLVVFSILDCGSMFISTISSQKFIKICTAFKRLSVSCILSK